MSDWKNPLLRKHMARLRGCALLLLMVVSIGLALGAGDEE